MNAIQANINRAIEEDDKFEEYGVPQSRHRIIIVGIKKEENLKFEIAYKALDKAQISVSNNHFMKAVSELNEAKFNLKDLKIGTQIIKEVDNRIGEFQEKLGKKPAKEDIPDTEEVRKVEMEQLKARVAARREERRKKVLDLLKKS